MLTRKRSTVAILGISMVIALFAAASTARMQSTTPDDGMPQFGLVGIAVGQVARLNAVMGNTPDDNMPFRVRLAFVDENGLPLHDRAGNEIAREVELMAGQGAWLDLDSRDVLSRFQLRTQIRPVVTVERVAGPEPVPFRVVATMELFNKLTGRTETLYAPPGGEVSGPEPQPF